MRVRVKSRSTGPVSQDPPSVQVRTLFVVLDVLGQLDSLVGDCRTEHAQVLDVECFLEHASDTHHQNISKPGQSRPKQAKASQSKPKQAKAGQTAMCGLVCGPRPSSCRLHFRQSARSRPFPHRPFPPISGPPAARPLPAHIRVALRIAHCVSPASRGRPGAATWSAATT